MTRSRQTSRARRGLAGISALVLIVGAGLFPATAVATHEPTDTVIKWNEYAVEALSNAGTATPPGLGLTPPVASIYLAMVQGAVYDAVNAIDGRYEPYLDDLPKARRHASMSAAAATAAYDVLVGMTVQPAMPQNVKDSLLARYNEWLTKIRDGSAKTNGKRIGAAVARLMLDERSDDGRYGPFRFVVGTTGGAWRPTTGTANDPNAWVAEVEPFTLRTQSQFRTQGPYALSSAAYVADYNEVKALGVKAVEGAVNPRNDAQNALATFFSANPLPIMNRALRNIAGARGLSTAQQARLFALSSMSGADALIGCWDDKKRWSFWRPETAIHLDDSNSATAPDASWAPNFAAPPYPDHPSGYTCFTAAMMHTAKNYFGTDRMTFTLTSPGVTPATPLTRTYTRFTAVLKDTIDARVYMGIHFRNPDVQGARLGQKVANWVSRHFFEREGRGHR